MNIYFGQIYIQAGVSFPFSFSLNDIQRIMRRKITIVISYLVLLTGCVSSQGNPASASDGPIVGTWKWVSFDKTPVSKPFFIRYFSDGTAATWPAPKGWKTTVEGVSYGRFHLDGDFLVIETGLGVNDPKTKFKIKGDELIFDTAPDENNVAHRLIYHRVEPDLKPGNYPPDQGTQDATKK